LQEISLVEAPGFLTVGRIGQSREKQPRAILRNHFFKFRRVHDNARCRQRI